MRLPIVLCCGTERPLFTNYHKIGVESLNSTCLQSFVHVCIQVIELQELACPIGRRCFCGFPKKEMYTQIWSIFSALPN